MQSYKELSEKKKKIVDILVKDHNEAVDDRDVESVKMYEVMIMNVVGGMSLKDFEFLKMKSYG